jgi:hypothetical protein
MGIAAAAPSILDSILANDGFWPDLPVRMAVETHRLQTDAREGALVRLLTEAMIETNEKLAAGKASAQAAGHATLAAWIAAHPPERVGGKPVVESLYFSAVLDWAKSLETERRASVQRQQPNASETEGTARIVGDFRDSHQRAVHRLLKRLAPESAGSADAGAYISLI